MIRRRAQQYVPATRHRHHRKRAHTHAVSLAFPIPTNGQRQYIGDEKLDHVLQPLRPIHCEVHMWVIPPGGDRRSTYRRAFSLQNIFGTLCYMQNSRDSSVWCNLAAAFGDGLAFGVGVALTRTAAHRVATRSATLELLPAADKLPDAGAMLTVIDARFTEIGGHIGQRLAELESKVEFGSRRRNSAGALPGRIRPDPGTPG